MRAEPLPPKLIEAELEAFYGSDYSGTLRSSGFPDAPQSFIVQRQSVVTEEVSRWFTQAVYRSRAAAEEAARHWEESRPTTSSYNLETGESTPAEAAGERLQSRYPRGPIARGPKALHSAFVDLCTSDHEWLVRTELGADETVALAAEFYRTPAS